LEQKLFSDSFHFIRYSFLNYKYTNARGGTTGNYIGYIRKGRARFVSVSEDFWVEEGEIVFIPYGCKYQSYWYGAPEIIFDSFAFVYQPEALHAPLQKVTADEKLLSSLSKIQTERGVCLHNVGALYLFLDALVPLLEKKQVSLKQAVVDAATAYMKNNIKNTFTVGDVAKACGVSESGLYAAFAQFGKTPVQVKNDMLISLAVQYLTATDMPITEISDRLQFHSTSYFRRVFAARYGCTPSQMRKNTKTI